MTNKQIEILLETLKKNNPENHFINNKGLSSLGKILFYPSKGKENISEKAHQYLRDIFKDDCKEVLNSLKKYHFSSFYTPDTIIDFQIKLLKNSGIDPKRILEPSAGNGAYVRRLSEAFPKAEIVALEPDKLSYHILSINTTKNPKITALNQTFEEYYLKHKDDKDLLFDLAISNIPFGTFKISNRYEHDYIENQNEYNINTFFNKYVPEMVKHGGHSFILTSKGFLDKTDNDDLRSDILNKNNLVDVYRFNNELFKNENTKVVSDLIIYQHDANKKVLKPKEKDFINTTPINLDESDRTFSINKYVNNQQDFINGTLDTQIFHNRTDLAVFSDPNDTLEDFLSKHARNSLKTQLSYAKTKTERQIEVVKTFNAKKQEIVSYDLDFIKTTDVNYLKEHTNLFKNAINIDPATNKLAFFIDNKIGAFAKNDLYDTLLKDYVRLRDLYVVFNLNLDNKNFTPKTLAERFNELNYQHDLFMFRYGSLHQYKTVLHKDFYFQTLANNLEQTKPDFTIEKNPKFNVKSLLSKLSEELLKTLENDKLEIQNNQNEFLQKTLDFSSPTEEKKPKEKKATVKTDLDKDLKKSETSNVTVEKEEIAVNGYKPVDFKSITDLKELAYKYYDRHGELDVSYFSEILKKPEKAILEEAFDRKLFFLNPQYDSNNEFKYFKSELFPVFKTGHIDNKIKTFEKEIDLNNNSFFDKKLFDKTIDFLKSLKNEKVDLKDIYFNFESTFIPDKYKEEFLKDIIEEKVSVKMSQFQYKIELDFTREFNTFAHNKYSIKKADGGTSLSYKKMLEHFANNKYPLINKTISVNGEDKRVVDEDATLKAYNLYEQLEIDYKTYFENNIALKEEIEDNYYDQFLSYKNFEIEDNILTFPESMEHDPYEHQKQGVMFGLLKGTALFDHEVGHGKTMSMAMLSDKLLQHKKAKTVFIATTKTIAPQLYKEVKLNMPHLKIFQLTTKNFSKKERNSTLRHLKEEKYNLVIGYHGQLQFIPKEKKYVIDTIQDKIDMVDRNLETAQEQGELKITGKVVNGLVQRRETLESELVNRLKTLEAKHDGIDKDLTLKTIGIDALLIDEAHEFKNIGYNTRHDRVSGLNSSIDTGKSLDMEASILSIHDRVGYDKNVFFYSGTPIKNSVTELYAYQRYLTPKHLKSMKIDNFDAWASVFLKQSMKAEKDVFGDTRLHKRFRYYTNLPELTKMYYDFTHVSNSNTFKTTSLTVQSDFKVLNETDKIIEFKEASKSFAQNKNQLAIFKSKSYTDKQMKASTVIALQFNRKVLIDPLLQKDVTIDFKSEDQIKLNTLIKDAHDIYKMSHKDKGVTLIFSDLGVWKRNEYNTYDAIKNKLHEIYNIPLEEIGIAHEYSTSKRKLEFQDKINKGDIRIAIGSTATLGTGLNIQKRALAVLHLDIPYSPDAYIQRLGRALRKGNMIAQKYGNKIIEISYGIKNTTDIFSYSLKSHKEKFIKQIKDLTNKERTYDDYLTKDEDLSHSQREAALVGDMDAFKMSTLEKDLNSLEKQKALFDAVKQDSQNKISKSERSKVYTNDQKGLYETIYKDYENQFPKLLNINELKEKEKQELMFKALKSTLVHDIGLQDGPKNYKELAAFLYNKVSHLETDQQFLGIRDQVGILKLNNSLDPNVKGDEFFIKRSYNKILEKLQFNYGIKSYKDNKTTMILGKPKYSISKENIGEQFFRIASSVPNIIQEKKFSIKMIDRELKSHHSNISRSFPKEKTEQIESLKNKIKTLKLKSKL